MSDAQRREALASFDQVWETVRARHWDPSLGGVNWDAVRAELRPKVEKAQSEEEVRAVISDMLSRLHLTHYGVVPASVYRDVENTKPVAPVGPGGKKDASGEPLPDAAETSDFDTGTTGLDVRVVDGDALVSSVEPQSPAGKAGVRPGWSIRQIDEVDLMPVLRRVSAAYAASTLQSMMLARAVTGRLEGPVENPVDVVFRDGRDRPVRLALARETPRGKPEHFGYMPESWLWADSRYVGHVGYIQFNYFLDPNRLSELFEKTIAGCVDCSGIVIDVRGNPGGIGILAMGLAGFFIDTPNLQLGTLTMRDVNLKFVVNPRAPSFHGPLAVLIDGLSASTSEIFAGGLQDLKRARIFGTRSAGAALPSMFERLPDGDGFQFAIATYRSESGKTLEGTGVTPDVTVPLSREALLANEDPALNAALQWIDQQQSTKGTETQ